jgi:hypothetical protein
VQIGSSFATVQATWSGVSIRAGWCAYERGGERAHRDLGELQNEGHRKWLLFIARHTAAWQRAQNEGTKVPELTQEMMAGIAFVVQRGMAAEVERLESIFQTGETPS